MFSAPPQFMVKHPTLGMGEGNNGFFIFHFPATVTDLLVQSSDGGGWEHVSVSTRNRCPTWDEMCFIKDYFWDAYDCVVQYHPPKSEYVNNHRFCLHLWRPKYTTLPLPPSIYVGIK